MGEKKQTSSEDLNALLEADTNNVLLDVLCTRNVLPDIDEQRLCQTIVHHHLSGKRMASLLMWCTECEIDRARAHPNTIFRANTMKVRIIASYIRIFGGQYLRDVVGPVVEKVLAYKKTLEVNPSTSDKKISSSDLSKRFSTIVGFADQLLENIYNSVDTMPFHLRALFASIFGNVTHTFPSSSSVGSTAVGGFLFLRFVGPAIISPERHGLSNAMPSLKAKRTLLILSKIIIALANSSQISDPHLVVLNKYVAKHQVKVLQWLYKVGSDQRDRLEDLDRLPPTPEVLEGRDPDVLSYMFLVLHEHRDKLVELMTANKKYDCKAAVSELERICDETAPPQARQERKALNVAVSSELIQRAKKKEEAREVKKVFSSAKSELHAELLRANSASEALEVANPSKRAKRLSASSSLTSLGTSSETKLVGTATLSPPSPDSLAATSSPRGPKMQQLRLENAQLREVSNMLGERVSQLEVELSKAKQAGAPSSPASPVKDEKAVHAATCCKCEQLSSKVEVLSEQLELLQQQMDLNQQQVSVQMEALLLLCTQTLEKVGGNADGVLSNVACLSESVTPPPE